MTPSIIKLFNDLSLYELSQPAFKKVMLGTSNDSLNSEENERCFILESNSLDVVLDLYKAISARPVYESAVDLPLEDLFYVGGKLQKLITKAEMILQKDRDFISSYYPIYTVQERIEEARRFRQYIITRIKNGK